MTMTMTTRWHSTTRSVELGRRIQVYSYVASSRQLAQHAQGHHTTEQHPTPVVLLESWPAYRQACGFTHLPQTG